MKLANNLSLAVAMAVALGGLPACSAAITSNRSTAAPQDEKKKDKKKKDNSKGSEDSPDNVAGAKRAIKRTLGDFQDGIEGKSPRRVTDLLDERFEDFPRFEDAVTQFLERT